MAGRRRQEDRSAATRSALITAARALFAERGYAETSRDEIVAQAGVTRGALHHHFGGKAELFRAVHEAVERELAEQIAAASVQKRDPMERLEAGCRAFLGAIGATDVQRIALLDAPAVLGWQTCREVDATYGLGLLRGGLQAGMDAARIPQQPVGPLASFILGGLMETAMRMAREPDAAVAKAEAAATVTRLLRGLTRDAV
jgi:AcrR family transcriptional regulator